MSTDPTGSLTSGTAAPPLDQPYYRAPFPAAVGRFFAKYATFGGRAGRAEYWWWALAATLVQLGVQLVHGLATGDWTTLTGTSLDNPGEAVLLLFGLATLVPSLAILWRRLHDINRSGAWFFFGLIPLVGWITLLVFTLLPPDPQGRRFDGGQTIRPV